MAKSSTVLVLWIVAKYAFFWNQPVGQRKVKTDQCFMNTNHTVSASISITKEDHPNRARTRIREFCIHVRIRNVGDIWAVLVKEVFNALVVTVNGEACERAWICRCRQGT